MPWMVASCLTRSTACRGGATKTVGMSAICSVAPAAPASAISSSWDPYAIRPIVLSTENPRSSALRAQVTSSGPSTSNRELGRPMPTSTSSSLLSMAYHREPSGAGRPARPRWLEHEPEDAGVGRCERDAEDGGRQCGDGHQVVATPRVANEPRGDDPAHHHAGGDEADDPAALGQGRRPADTARCRLA